MDVYPTTPAARAAVVSLGKNHSLNVGHRCGPACRYARRGTVAVCLSSLHTHNCGKRCVDPALHVATPEGTTCRLTGLVVRGPEEVLSPKLCADGSFSRHWEIHGTNPARTRRKKAQTAADGHAKLRAAVAKMCCTIFLSPARKAAAARACRKAGERAGRPTASFFELMARAAREARGVARGAALTAERAAVVQLGGRVGAMVMFAVEAGFKSKNHGVTAAAILTLMQDGFVVGGCTMIERERLCEHYLPTQTQLGAMPGLQCRAITLAIRALKRFMVTAAGEPRPERALLPVNCRRYLQQIK